MAIRSGQILFQGNNWVIDRIQSAGPGTVNIPEEKIYEVGNFNSLATVRDIPDLSFDVESLDVSCEIEAIITGADPTTISAGQEFDLTDSKPLDIISPFKSAVGQYDIINGVVVPYLTLESATYRFGVRANATQSYTFRGDSILYTNDVPYAEQFTITAGANQVYTLAQTAVVYSLAGDSIYVLSVCAKTTGSNVFKRLYFGTDYTNTATTFTVVDDLNAEGYTTLHVTYATAASISYTQTGNNPEGFAVHQGISVKPAAIRGKDIDLYVGDTAATPTFTRWAGVQSVEITRRVNLEADEELGNYNYVAYDYDVPEVSGTVTLRPVNAAEFMSKIYEILNVNTAQVAGPHTSVGLPLEIRIGDPDSTSTLKTFYVPDARFQAPGFQGRVQQKTDITLNWSSDSGVLLTYNESRP